jgi:hypothetical protein
VYFFWEVLPFFSALYGFIGCIVIIIGSKALGRFWLQKDEDYYEKHGFIPALFTFLELF